MSRNRQYFPRTKPARIGFLIIAAFGLFASGCGVRFDMQDQPRYKAYKESKFFTDKRASRNTPDGTVARGQLHENKALYTGKVDNPDLNAVAETSTDASGNTLVSSFPNAIDEFPMPVTKELIERGQNRFDIYCAVCHGPMGDGDGMVVRRGFPQPPTYHDDRLRNAPVGHFFDVATNGWGRMSGYGPVISAPDRWAIVAYIRALQISKDPNGISTMNSNTQKAPEASKPAANTSAANSNAETGGGK